MKVLSFVVTLLLFLSLSAILPAVAFNEPGAELLPSYAPDLVKIKLSSAANQRADLPEGLYAEAASFGIEELDRLMLQTGGQKIIRAHRRVKDTTWEHQTGFHRWFLIKLDGRMAVEEAVKLFKQSSLIEKAGPEYIFYDAAIPNDTYYSYNWGHNNTAQLPSWYPVGSPTGGHTGTPVGTVGFDSDAQLAWDRSQYWGSSGIVIAVIDSGADLLHPDLRLVTGWDYGDGDSNPMDNSSSPGHGTACSGIAAAKANNSLGVAGIAGGCSVMPLKHKNSAGINYFTATNNCLTYAADHGVEVISMSFGNHDLYEGHLDAEDTDDALEYAYSHGCVMFAATGNQNSSHIGYPANHNKVISVGAASPTGQRKSYISSDGEYWWGSNYGSAIQDSQLAVDLMGPTILPTTDLMGTNGYNESASPAGDYYMWFNGTSCATPYVAGTAALLLSKSPTLTQTQVKNILYATATDMTVDGGAGWDRYTGYGLVNADRALVNVWDGSSSTTWHNASNWSLNMVPISTQDLLIPAGCPRYPIVTDSRSCHDVMVENAASITISTGYLTANGDFTSYGLLVMNNMDGTLYVTGDLIFESGATTTISAMAEIYVDDDLEFRAGSNVNMASGYLYVHGAGVSWIRTYSPATVYHLLSDKDSGSTSVFSGASTASLTIGGNLFVYAGSTLYNYYNGNIILKGGMWVYTGAVCQFNFGTLSLEGSGTSNIRFYEYGIGNHLNNLRINKTSGYSTLLLAALEVAGNVTIDSGTFNPNNWPVYVGGSWYNNLGPASFIEGTGEVILNGTGSQYLYTENFNILRLDKSSGIMFIPSGRTVTCASYDWESGAYAVTGGTFTVADLADSGVFGTIAISSGTINYTQDNDPSSYPDLRCNLTMSGGTFNITGGMGPCYFGLIDPLTLNLSGGVLNINHSIYIQSTALITENITGGTIRTVGYVSCQNPGFTPSGGVLEMYGTSDASLTMVAGSNLWDLRVNKNPAKSAGSQTIGMPPAERDGTIHPQNRSQTANANSDLVILHDFVLNTGVFDANGHNMTVGGIWDNNAANTSAFTAGTGTVYFNQAGSTQSVYGPNVFNTVIDNHTAGALTFHDATTINSLTVNNIVTFHNANTLNTVLNSAAGGILAFYYGYTSTIGSYTGGGSLRAWSNSHVIVSDLAQSGLYGSFTAGSGHLEFHQDTSSYTDINGNMTIQDNGIVDIYGTYSDCYIGYDGDCVLTMTSGELNIRENGFYIENNGNTVDFVVSGGTIRVNGNWFDSLGIFDPSGGSVEMTGTADNNITCHSTSWFHTLEVNKTLTREAEPGPEFRTDRQGNITPITRTANLNIGACTINGGYTQTAANSVYLMGNMNSAGASVTNTISAGVLRLNGYSLTSLGNLNVYGSLAIDPTSSLLMGASKALNVYSGGYLLLGGNSSNPSTITRSGTGYYSLNIRSGGTIGAIYAIFEYMNTSGVYLMEGSSVNTDYCLENCTFRNGAANGRLLTISNTQSFIVRDAVFPANTWSGYYNVYKSTDSGVVYFSGWSGAFGGEDYDYDFFNRVFWEGSGSPDIEDLQISYVPATNRIQLDWTYPLEVPSFNIYRSADPYGTFGYVGSSTGLSWSQVVPGPYYFYKVTAVLP